MMLRALDKLSLIGMALGIAMMLQPCWAAGFAIGFFFTLASTMLQILASHIIA